MNGILTNRWLSIGCRLLLGVVFVLAALHKIEAPGEFAKVVWGYKLLPAGLVNLWALYLPWFELVGGVALVLGVARRGAAALVGVLLLVFVIALGVNLARGIDFDCGCFAHEDPTSGPASYPVLGAVMAFLFTSPDPWVTLARDLFLLLLVVQVLWSPIVWRAPVRSAGGVVPALAGEARRRRPPA